MHRSIVSKEFLTMLVQDPKTPLPKEVQKRFEKILRIKDNEIVALFDGQGRQVEGQLEHIAGQCFFKNTQFKNESAPRQKIILLQAAIEEAKLVECLKRNCEFGIDEIIIFQAERSKAFCFDKLKKREGRLHAVLEDAARQSGRLFVPKISLVENFSESFSLSALKIFGSPDQSQGLHHFLSKQKISDEKIILIAVGPEGGLSEHEENKFLQNNFVSLNWAPFILRTESAGLAALAIIQGFLQGNR